MNDLKADGTVTSVVPDSSLSSLDTVISNSKRAAETATVTPTTCQSKLRSMLEVAPAGVPLAGGVTAGGSGNVVLRAYGKDKADTYLTRLNSLYGGCPTYTVKTSSASSSVKTRSVSGVSAPGAEHVLAFRQNSNSGPTSYDVINVFAISDSTLVQITTTTQATAAQLSSTLGKVVKVVQKDS